jgi:hypothetical protein
MRLPLHCVSRHTQAMAEAVSRENVSARLAEIRGQLTLLADYL